MSVLLKSSPLNRKAPRSYSAAFAGSGRSNAPKRSFTSRISMPIVRPAGVEIEEDAGATSSVVTDSAPSGANHTKSASASDHSWCKSSCAPRSKWAVITITSAPSWRETTRRILPPKLGISLKDLVRSGWAGSGDVQSGETIAALSQVSRMLRLSMASWACLVRRITYASHAWAQASGMASVSMRYSR